MQNLNGPTHESVMQKPLRTLKIFSGNAKFEPPEKKARAKWKVDSAVRVGSINNVKIRTAFSFKD